MSSVLIINATIVTPNEVISSGMLQIIKGKIIKIEKNYDLNNIDLVEETYTIIDAAHSYVMPGIIDLHTDALEAEIIPRPGADMPIDIAFRELERKMSGCGFTTVYHSMHLGYKTAEYGSRSKYKRSQVYETVYKALKVHTLLNNKIHLRFELSGVGAYAECLSYIDKNYIEMLSVMDHTPGQGQYTREIFIESSIKSGLTEEQAIARFEEMRSRPVINGEALANLIGAAKNKGIAVASHDDDTIEKVDLMNSLGVTICEFPINMEAAKHANKLGQHVVGGASNILRGGSLTGNLNMTDAVLEGVVDSICSDYYPPAIIHAVFKLHQEHAMPLTETVKLATLQPAIAAGINSYTGSIEIGKDGDIILVKLVNNLPMVTHTIVRGVIVAQVPQHITYHG